MGQKQPVQQSSTRLLASCTSSSRCKFHQHALPRCHVSSGGKTCKTCGIQLSEKPWGCADRAAGNAAAAAVPDASVYWLQNPTGGANWEDSGCPPTAATATSGGVRTAAASSTGMPEARAGTA
ncbi:hypothetical protein HaLaN_02281 [Haematococcus lacustris]|uniref:Uncharacterized protein n=1 Tax=Haematococcus lacustris TaxID=44745 RepID=A0A699YKI3_HAELA|nr:hypothetical protein HaLaN_02281 [Haematococcus lacustris]